MPADVFVRIELQLADFGAVLSIEDNFNSSHKRMDLNVCDGNRLREAAGMPTTHHVNDCATTPLSGLQKDG